MKVKVSERYLQFIEISRRDSKHPTFRAKGKYYIFFQQNTNHKYTIRDRHTDIVSCRVDVFAYYESFLDQGIYRLNVHALDSKILQKNQKKIHWISIKILIAVIKTKQQVRLSLKLIFGLQNLPSVPLLSILETLAPSGLSLRIPSLQGSSIH